MNQMLHIIRKDLRRLRWLLVGWVAIIIGRLVLSVAGSSVEPADTGLQLLFANLSSLVGLLEMLMWALLISFLIHDEPLVGADAFWLTRPIDRNGLMRAKLTLAALLFLLAPSVQQATEMAWFGASPRDLLVAAPTLLFTQAFWVVLLVAAAVLTPSLIRFVLTIAAGTAAFIVGIGAITTLLVLTRPEERAYDDGPFMPDPSAKIVATLLLMCVGLGVIVYQYRHRWLSRAILIGTGGAVAALVVASIWPWHFARGAEPDPGPWAHDITRTIAVLDVKSPPHVSDAHSLRPTKIPKKRVAARVDLVGAPAEYSVEAVGVRARLTFPDGTSIESAQRDGAERLRVSGDQPPNRMTQLQAVLGGVRLARNTIRDFPYDMLPVLLKVTDADYQRYGERAGHLTATVDFALNRFRMFGSLPLSAGAATRDKTARFEIVRVLRAGDSCEVLVRHVTVQPIWPPVLRREFQYVLRNRERGEAVEGDYGMLLPRGELNIAGALFGLSVDRSAQGFSVWSQNVHYPSGAMSASPTPRIDSAWLDGADLVVIESAYAGHVTRTLDIEGFRMRQ